MTPQRAAELLPIITAFAEGKSVECRGKAGGEWERMDDPRWTDACDYRIAKSPSELWIVSWPGSPTISVWKTECEAREHCMRLAAQGPPTVTRYREVL